MFWLLICCYVISIGHNSRNSDEVMECIWWWPCEDTPLPVCGSDGQTYSNLCDLQRTAGCVEAKRDLVVASNGTCNDEESKWRFKWTILKLILVPSQEDKCKVSKWLMIITWSVLVYTFDHWPTLKSITTRYKFQSLIIGITWILFSTSSHSP